MVLKPFWFRAQHAVLQYLPETPNGEMIRGKLKEPMANGMHERWYWFECTWRTSSSAPQLSGFRVIQEPSEKRRSGWVPVQREDLKAGAIYRASFWRSKCLKLIENTPGGLEEIKRRHPYPPTPIWWDVWREREDDDNADK
jgi:hypothetical protein